VALPPDAAEAAARVAALADENVKKFIADKTERKFIYVPGRVVNFIVG
jgi:leucyl-tRNA synthetase